MSDQKSKREIELSESSWKLIDDACEFDAELSPSELIDLIVQGSLTTVDASKQQSVVDYLNQVFGERRE